MPNIRRRLERGTSVTMLKPALRAAGAAAPSAPERVAPGTAETIAAPAAIGERVEALDMLRGLMALAVAVYHLGAWTRAFSESEARNAVILLGIYSVQGFFVISGFCFFALYRHTRFGWEALRRFHVRRFLRIAPLYFLAMALTYALDQPVLAELTWFRLAENLTLTFGLVHPNHSAVLGGWSIGIEYVFYLGLPILLWVTRHAAALWLVTLLLMACAMPITLGQLQATPEPARFNVYVAVANHAFLFMLGALIADARARTALRLPWALLLGLLVALCVWTGDGDGPIVLHTEVMCGVARIRYVALCTAIVALCAVASKPSPALSYPFVWLGDLSYSVYLMHPFAHWGASRTLPADTHPSVQLLCSLGMTLLLASIAHRLVERPAIAWGRRLSAAG